MTPYKVLGVSENATQDEIRKAYLALVKKYHPDRYSDGPMKDMANEKLKEINQAYELLTKKKESSGYTIGSSGLGGVGVGVGIGVGVGSINVGVFISSALTVSVLGVAVSVGVLVFASVVAGVSVGIISAHEESNAANTSKRAIRVIDRFMIFTPFVIHFKI